MQAIERYFDNAATTPLDPRVREAMAPFFGEAFGNANSIHSWGRLAREAVERSREEVARLLGAEDPLQITFTSGATESDNWVLAAHPDAWIGPFEHSAVYEPATRSGARLLPHRGLEIDPPPIGAPDALVSVMAVNNEFGSIWSPQNLGRSGDVVHSDITQAVAKIGVDLDGLDFASFSAHKFYGPKGIGALYSKDHAPSPLILGGEQEHGFRGGTLPVPLIVGMGAAATIAMEEAEENYRLAQSLRQVLLDGLKDLPDMRINGGKRTSPYIVSVSFLGLEAEAIVLELDRAGFAISAGAACSSESSNPSRVLMSLTSDESWARGTIRVSFGRYNSAEAAEDLAERLRTTVEMLRTL